MTYSKIAIIDPVGKKAGLDHYDVYLAKSLDRLGFKVTVFSNFDSEDSKISKRVFPFYVKSTFIKVVHTIWNFLKALRISKRENNEIVVLHVFHFSFIDYFFTKLSKIFGMKVCLIVHDVYSLVENRKPRWLRDCIKHSEIVVVHNDNAAQELKSQLDQKYFDKIHVIPHGNYTDCVLNVEKSEALEKLNLNPAKNYLLFFGMIKKSKGLEDLINAMKEVDDQVHLIIAGRLRDVRLEEIKRILKHLSLESRVHLNIRYISNYERNIFFNAADAVVIPYHRIYQSGVLIMAMSYGKVVIASDLTVNKSMLNENRGVLFKVGNSSDLAQKINSVFMGKINVVQMQNSASKYISEKNNWADIATEFSNILRK